MSLRSTYFFKGDVMEIITNELGGTRESKKDKKRYDLIPVELLDRLADHYGKGALIHGDNNWRLLITDEDLTIMKAAAFRHFMSWLKGEDNEDHLSALVFNVIAFDINLQENKRRAIHG